MDTKKLQRGALVRALEDMDPEGANVPKGMLGVVFETAADQQQERNVPADHEGIGPLVRWFKGGVCNVYDGQVERVSNPSEEKPGQLVIVDIDLNGQKPYELVERSVTAGAEDNEGYHALESFFEDIGYTVRSAVISERRFS